MIHLTGGHNGEGQVLPQCDGSMGEDDLLTVIELYQVTAEIDET